MKIKISKSQWEQMGKVAGWIKAQKTYSDLPGRGDVGGYPGIPYDEIPGERFDSEKLPEKYKLYLNEFAEKKDKMIEDDIQETISQISKGTPIEQINTVLAKDIQQAKIEKNVMLNDYNFNDEKDLREWATWIEHKNKPMSFDEFKKIETSQAKDDGWEWDPQDISYYF